jgi:adenosylcobinamide-phosphate synthase
MTTRNQFRAGIIWTLTGIAVFFLPFWKIEKHRQRKHHNNTDKQKKNVSITFHLFPPLLHALLLKPVFAYRGLRRAAIAVTNALAKNDLPEARRLLSWHLVSRDTPHLSEAEVVGATIESLAENLTDSVTAPLLAYAAGGLPAAWAYRFVNTADAMWGYRTPEFEQLGKFPAHLDDAVNWFPARLTGWLLVAAACLAREDAGNAARTMLSQHYRSTSPNAGWTMSAMAGALHVTLTKRGYYELKGGQEKLDVITIKRALRVADICVGLILLVIVLGSVMDRTRDLREKLPFRFKRTTII